MDFNLSSIKKRSVGEVVGGLKATSTSQSKEAGATLIDEAKKVGLNLRDYLTLAVKAEGEFDGYELALAELNLPIRNDFKAGVVLQAASDTFQTFPGTRAMFPEVIDDMLRWAGRQDQFEQIGPMISNSRTINGVELISTVVDDDADERGTSTITEGGRIPVRTIRTSQNTVGMFKHGSAIRTTYEFTRRASLDLLTPYANRIARELQISKVGAAVNMLVNGDDVHAAAGVISQSAYNTLVGTNSTNNVLSWEHMLAWLVARAQAGTPVDTVVGNWDSAFRWAKMWQAPTTGGPSGAANFAAQASNVGNLNIPLPTFAVASTAPATKLVGLSRGDTLEELVEAGSLIAESERAILNQTVTYTKTENTGYRLVYGDTRSIFNYGA